MKLSEWAKQTGVTYKTAWRWFRDGKLPCPSEQIDTGTILVYPEGSTHAESTGKTVAYARVSSHDQKESLQRQINRIVDWCAANGITVNDEIKEIGSGLNGERRKLNRLLSDPEVKTIVVEHRDRLARFGVPMLEAALNASGRKIRVVNETECKDDIVQDFVDLATSMCARIYGKRSAEARAKKAVEAADED